MKLRNIEAAVLMVSAMFVCLAVGFFWGQSSAKGDIVVRLEEGSDWEYSPTSAGSADTEAAVSPDIAAQNSPQATRQSIVSPAPQEEQDPEPSTSEPQQTGTDAPESALIDINSASAQQLQALPGIGEVLSQRIVDYRREIGRFASYEQIMDVSGIGEATLAKIRDLITLG